MANLNLNYIDALNAYNKTADLMNKQMGGISNGDEVGRSDFTQMVANVLNSTVNDVKAADVAVKQSVTGEISTEDLAIAVANAEVSLKTLMSIRDKIVAAYQDILRMPI